MTCKVKLQPLLAEFCFFFKHVCSMKMYCLYSKETSSVKKKKKLRSNLVTRLKKLCTKVILIMRIHQYAPVILFCS